MAVAELSLPIGIRSSERCIQALLTLQRRVTLHHITYHITDTAAEVGVACCMVGLLRVNGVDGEPELILTTRYGK